MNKKIYLCIITIITVICILFGTVYHVSGWFTGGFLGSIFAVGDSDGHTAGSEIGQGRITYSEKQDAFDSIKIDASVLDISVETGDDYHISYDCVSYLTPEISMQNKTLVIKQPSVPKLNKTDNLCIMTITVPADTTLLQTNIQTDVGDVSLTGILSGNVTLLADVGNIEGDSCILSHTTAEADVGAITFRSCDLTEGEMSADVGAISLDNCTFTDLELSGDLGDITVRTPLDLSDYYLDFSVDLGSLKVNGNTYKSSYEQKGSGKMNLEIENSLGNVEVEYPE